MVAFCTTSGCKERPSAAPAPSATPAPKPAASASAKPEEAALKPVRHVVILTVDALRADMPWVGYPRDIAPNLTRLAKDSVVFSKAYALSSYTSMSLAGLMSGRFPSELPRDGRTTSSFGPELNMLAEVLKAKKFHTLGVHGHVYFLGDTGIAQGFEEWRVVPKITSLPARDGHIVDDKLADLLIDSLKAQEKRGGDSRLFAWAHFMDPHYSYALREGLRYRGSAYDARDDAGASATLSSPAPSASAGAPKSPSSRASAATPHEPRAKATRAKPPSSDAARRQPIAPGVPLTKIGQRLRNMYDAEVHFTDKQVGRVLDYLRSRPYYANTAIIVTSDHGEAFGEHKSYFEHGYYLHEVTTRVPLLVRVPGAAHRRIDQRRSHIDLGRTIFELVGLKAPKSFRGTSLVAEMQGLKAPPRPVIIDMPYTDQTPRRRALILDDKKIVVTETEEVPTLFDLKADPGERRDLASEKPKLLETLFARWKEQNKALPDYPAPRRSKRGY